MRLEAKHGIVCSMPDERYGYFGWTTVARMDDDEIVVAASGLKSRKFCPFGKIVTFSSRDHGATWSKPEALNEIPLDERDGGIICLGGRARLVCWECVDVRQGLEGAREMYGEEEVATWGEALGTLTDELVARWRGSWARISDDGEAWGEPIPLSVGSPHGPIRLSNGDLLYVGHPFPPGGGRHPLRAIRSTDRGGTWTNAGVFPSGEGCVQKDFSEPHAVELPSGKLIAMLRYNGHTHTHFSLFQSESGDGGETWSAPRPTSAHGAPAHLMVHSSGAIVGTYSYRRAPLGQRATISWDEGESWTAELVLRDDGPDEDLGYPSSVELADGSILSVYYQKLTPGKNTSVLWSRWDLPSRRE